MNLRKLPLKVRTLICLALLALVPKISSAAAINCDLATLQAVVSNVNAAPTITCKAGQWTWNAQLIITRGVVLKAETKGATLITSNTGNSYLISYDPADYSKNEPFRISGFVFDINPENESTQNGGGIDLGNPKSPPYTIQTNLRIDNNVFKNQTHHFTDTGLTQQAIYDNGVMRGLVDNNEFLNYSYPVRSPNAASGGQLWKSSDPQFNSFAYGTAESSMYYEDNTFTKPNSDNGQRPVADCQYSGRYVFRYNVITVYSQQYPLFDMHGYATAGGPDYSCFGGEIYGNRIIGGSGGIRLLDQRGGRVMVFANRVEGLEGSEINVRAEFDDRPTGVIQRVYDSFYWNNRIDADGDPNKVTETANGFFDSGEGSGNFNDLITPNENYYDYNASFSATAGGIGVGTRAQRPATCKANESAYWETNDINPTSLINRVGAGVGANAPKGELYKCGSDGKWPTTTHYKPLAYPHPIRTNCAKYPQLCDAGSVARKPSAPTNLHVI